MEKPKAILMALMMVAFLAGGDNAEATDGEALCRAKKLTACAKLPKAQLGCHTKAMKSGGTVAQGCLDKAAA